MGNIKDRQYLKEYLAHIGEPVEELDSRISYEAYHGAKIISDYTKHYSSYYNVHTAHSLFFLEKINELYAKSPLDELIYGTSEFAFNFAKKHDNSSALKALGLFFKEKENIIEPKHYIFMADQYIKNIPKRAVIFYEFLNYFDIDKLDKKYLSCLAIATDNQPLLEKILKNNHTFSQVEYMFAMQYDNAFVKKIFENSGQKIIYGKEIEALFISEFNILDITKLSTYLEKFVTNIEDLTSLKISIQDPTNKFKTQRMVNINLRNPRKDIILNEIDKRLLFMELENTLEHKSEPSKNRVKI